MEKIVSKVPELKRSCRVRIRNHTDLPLTAVCIKWLLAHRLAPGAESEWVNCPVGEGIEFQFAEKDTVYEDILWAVPTFPFRGGHHYRIIVEGPPSAPVFDVTEEKPEDDNPAQSNGQSHDGG